MKISLKIDLQLDVNTKSNNYKDLDLEDLIDVVTGGFKRDLQTIETTNEVTVVDMEYEVLIEGTVK